MMEDIGGEKYVTVNNKYNIRYLEQGDKTKEHVILLHGLGGSANSWNNNIAPLAESFHVIALDILGFGKSDKPKIDYTMNLFVNFVAEFMDALAIDKANLVGSSLGGQIAAEFALKYNDTVNSNRVNKLVLICPAGFSPRVFKGTAALHSYTRIFHAKSIERLKILLEKVHGSSISDDYLTWMYQYIKMENAKHAFMSALRNSAKAERLTRRFKNMVAEKINTLVIWGKDDKIIPVKYCEPFIDMPNCRLIVLENCGHRPHVEVSELFNTYIKLFLLKALK